MPDKVIEPKPATPTRRSCEECPFHVSPMSVYRTGSCDNSRKPSACPVLRSLNRNQSDNFDLRKSGLHASRRLARDVVCEPKARSPGRRFTSLESAIEIQEEVGAALEGCADRLSAVSLHAKSTEFCIGCSVTRVPVAFAIALASATAAGGTPGSPTPVGASVEGTMCTSILRMPPILSGS